MTRGCRARRDRRSTRPRPRPVRQGLLAAAVVGLSLLNTGGAGAAVPSPAPAAPAGRPTQEPGVASIELVEQTPWVRPGEQLRLRFRVEQVPADASAQLIIHDPLVTRGDFADTLDGELGSTKAPSPTQSLTDLTRATDGTYELAVTIGGEGGINLSEHGVYPFELVVTDAPGTALTSLVSYLLLLPASDEEFPPLGVAVVMEIGGPPGLKPDGTVQPDEATTGHINDRIEALTQAAGVPLTVAPVPETLDALAGRGEPGLETLERLRRAVGQRDVLSRPYVDLDLDALAAAGLLPQVPPEALAGAQVLRERLHEPLERTWLTGATVGDAEVNALRDLGIGRVLVPESAVEGLTDQSEGPVPVGPVNLTDDGPLAAVTDDTLASRLLGGEGELDTQRFLAELTMIWLAKPSISDRAVVVRIPEDAPIEPVVLGRALQALTDGGAVQAITVDDYFALPPVGGEKPVVIDRTSDGAPTDLRSITRPLENGQRAISGLAGTLDDRETIQSLYRSLLISLGAELTMAQRRAYINRVGEEVARISDGVNAPPDFKITLTARSGTIPLTIENRTDQTVSVDVLLQSSQLEFPDGDHKKVVVPAGGRRIDLQVRTRTSGAFPLHITLTSPDRNVVFDRTTFTIRSTAVSGVGLVLSVGAGAFLLIWWARHWRTARRSRGVGH
ncbi:MAG TPA: DUF6049 family protein [Acidimicrobiales bacterium]|nr:DUF6049 family protein [Acidimicrobiales bacterium]